MAKTRVSHAILTVTTIDVFIQTMQFIQENNLWDDAKAFLKSNGKTEMFFDYEVLHHFRQMLHENPGIGEDHPAKEYLYGHTIPWTDLE